MKSVPAILKQAREDAGLSVRALARRTGVAASTITRVESGKVDPTIGMLTRILEGAGQALSLEVTSSVHGSGFARRSDREIAALASAWERTPLGELPDFTRLRSFLDALVLEPGWIQQAIELPPPPSGSATHDSLLAGIAEKLADDTGISRPRWTKKVPALAEEWTAPGTPRMRQRARALAPSQFARRNLAIDEGSLWRSRESIGV